MNTGKVFAIFFGILMMLTSIGLIIGGSALLILNEEAVDEDGYLSTSEITLSTLDDRAVAIVVDSIQIDDSDDFSSHKSSYRSQPGQFVQFRLQLPDNDDGTYFAGIADVNAVHDYLAEVTYQRISRISSLDDDYHISRDKFSLFDSHKNDEDFNFDFSQVFEIEFETVHANSNLSLEQDPADQDFWLASTTGTELEWAPEYGQFALVVMKTDGSPNIDTQVTIGARIPILTPIGGMLLVVGFALLLSSLVLFYVGIRSSSSSTGTQSRLYYVPVSAQSPKSTEVNDTTSEDSSVDYPSTEVKTIESKYCTQCGDIVDLDARFCSVCGHKVSTD